MRTRYLSGWLSECLLLTIAPPTSTPPTNGGGGAAAPTTAPVAAAPGQYPVGGVETGSGGWDNTLVPALTGSAALLLLGAGAGSLIRSRQLRTKAALITEA